MEKREHHSLLEKGDNSWCHFRPTDEGDGDRSLLGELDTLLGTRQDGGVHVEKQKLKVHILK